MCKRFYADTFILSVLTCSCVQDSIAHAVSRVTHKGDSYDGLGDLQGVEKQLKICPSHVENPAVQQPLTPRKEQPTHLIMVRIW